LDGNKNAYPSPAKGTKPASAFASAIDRSIARVQRQSLQSLSLPHRSPISLSLPSLSQISRPSSSSRDRIKSSRPSNNAISQNRIARTGRVGDATEDVGGITVRGDRGFGARERGDALCAREYIHSRQSPDVVVVIDRARRPIAIISFTHRRDARVGSLIAGCETDVDDVRRRRDAVTTVPTIDRRRWKYIHVIPRLAIDDARRRATPRAHHPSRDRSIVRSAIASPRRLHHRIIHHVPRRGSSLRDASRRAHRRSYSSPARTPRLGTRA